MKRFKQHWSIRPLSYLLSVMLMALPAMLLWMSDVPAARAQGAVRSAQPEWAVLDFTNTSGYGGAEVGREASDALVVELGRSNRYEVVTRQETQQALQDLGLTPPLNVIGLQKLGHNLNADAVVTGDVASVQFTSNPRQAKASVVIRVTDSVTGELVNGALAQGTSNPRVVPTNDDDALVNEAISNAAFAAVKQMGQFNLPKATVLNNQDERTILLNKGTRDGMYDGLQMVVTRNGTDVGRLRVAHAYADESDATVIVRGAGIQPGDRATAVYQLPAYSVVGTGAGGKVLQTNANISSDGTVAAPQRNAFAGAGGLLLAVLAGALLLNGVRNGNAQGSLGGAEVGKPAALAGRTDQLGGGQGTWPQDGFPVDLNFDPTAAVWVPIAVKVTATIGNIPISQFVEFHVYRNDFPATLASATILNTGTTTGTTGTTGTGGTGGTGNYPGNVPVYTQGGHQPLLFFDDGSPKAILTSKPDPISSATVDQATSSGALVPGTGIPQPGMRLQYFIEGLYMQPSTNGGSNGNPGNSNTAGNGTTSGTATTTGTNGNGTTGSTGGTPGGAGVTGGTTGGTGTNTGGTAGTTTGTGGGAGHGLTFQLTGQSPTNFVTWLEPVLLAPSDIVAGATSVTISAPATRGADSYVLYVAANSADLASSKLLAGDLSGVKVYAPNTANPCTDANGYCGIPATDPRQAQAASPNVVGFSFPPSDFPSTPQPWMKIGARDSRNGASLSVNPYVLTDPVQVPPNVVTAIKKAGSHTATASSASKASSILNPTRPDGSKSPLQPAVPGHTLYPILPAVPAKPNGSGHVPIPVRPSVPELPRH